MYVALFAAFATQAGAQDVQYKSVTKLDMGGAMNLVLKMAKAQEISETYSIKGRKMRTDSDKQSSIFDMENGRFIMINHDNKTYVSAPLSQMTAATMMMANNMNARSEKGVMTATAKDSVGNKMDFTFNVSMDPTNERENVNGQDARRTFATIETDMKFTEAGDTKQQDAGKIVLLIDSWNANGGPAYTAVKNFNEAMSKELRSQAATQMKGINAVMSQNPQMGEAMKKAAAEQAKIDGIAMRSTIHIVLVPVGMKFDRDLAVKPPEESAGNSAGKRMMGSLLSGALGGRKAEKTAESAAANNPKQSTMAKMSTEVRDVQSLSLPASLFEPPAGYKEVPFTPIPTRK
jgi:hypothetical protein